MKLIKVKETLEKAIKELTTKIEESIKITKEENKEEMMKLFKKEQIFIIGAIVIGIINIIVNFIK